MKTRLMVCGLLILMLAVFAGWGFAEDLVDFTISCEPASMAAPGDAQVAVRLTNMGAEDMQEPIALYDPDGKLVTGFYDGGSVLLKAGASATWQGAWSVTQEQLDAGEIAYTAKYSLLDGDGNVSQVQKIAKATVAFTGERALLRVTRTIDPEVVRSGKSVNVVYELVNAGTVPLSDIRIRENSSISASTKRVDALAVGASEQVTFTTAIKSADLKSAATITYKAQGGKDTLKETIPEQAIALAKPGLKYSLAADKTAVNIGDAVTLTLRLENNGNITYSGVTATDEKLGEVFTGIEVPAGQTVEKTKELIMQEKSAFKFKLTLPDNTGTTNEETTNEVTVSAYDPSQVLRLTLSVTTESTTVSSIPADVRFTVVVTNASDVTAKNVQIRHGDVTIYTIETLAPAQSVTLERDFALSEAGKYRFSAHTLDTLENPVDFQSNELMITYAAPTEVPTLIPVATIKPPEIKELPTENDVAPVLARGRDTLLIVALALAGVLAVCVALFGVSSVIRAKARRASEGAYDHLELGKRRDYTEKPAGEPRARFADDDEDMKAVVRTEDEELPSAKYLKQDAPEPLETEGGEAAGDVTGAYRLKREETAQSEPEVAEPAPEAVVAEAPAQRTRRAAKRRKAEEEESL